MGLDRLRDVRARIERACAASGRDVASVTLVAVGKQHPVAALRALYDAGVRDFGESRAHELAEKAAALPADVRWHFVGALQSNKLRDVLASAHLVHSFDRPDRAPAAAAHRKGARVLLQVNVGAEPQKRGVAPDAALRAVRAMLDAGLDVRGLMAIPPRADAPEASRAHFRALRLLRDLCERETGRALPELSMGMSADLEVAIEEGATLVRVGRGLFGTRAG